MYGSKNMAKLNLLIDCSLLCRKYTKHFISKLDHSLKVRHKILADGPVLALEKKINSGKLQEDEVQLNIAYQLQRVYDDIKHYKPTEKRFI
ncbi:hypothetical protein NQ314_019705 [Rhamnusium bicolor]|uniref:Uncharacterized protein n=1 Tax=Rhamnusium bicolor TaxID=1586634 RepID=A0AAV8WN10_9CUCU|nr:hypothetical protein NQ314_019705 [Rhamnusium bicolor]